MKMLVVTKDKDGKTVKVESRRVPKPTPEMRYLHRNGFIGFYPASTVSTKGRR